ncbi:putative succinate dehydrogenase membrane anchor subunit [Mycobacteroides abscessus MAB_082312_2258]|nr:putative succinate dehydrogenase membrane anchor subunit [Mycobacteroides abscessus MAB_082312_2258]
MGELPWFIPMAFISLPFLLAFRLTCYYYRKAYYRSVWQSPTACAVAEPHARYSGETRLPLIMQNIHRYFFYAAAIISVVNTYDAIVAFHSEKTGGFGFGMGNVILVTNVVLLWVYTLSCHSCRHVTGGRLKHFSKHPVRYWIWTQVSKLNTRHMLFAWITLGTLILTDLYIMLVASGTISDMRFVG